MAGPGKVEGWVGCVGKPAAPRCVGKLKERGERRIVGFPLARGRPLAISTLRMDL